MTEANRAVLYSPTLLGLAVELATFPLDETSASIAEVRSRTCGSTIMLGVAAGDDGRVTGIGARVNACAVGQAASAIFLSGAVGRNVSNIEDAADGIAQWLAGEGARPAWPRLELLEPALPHRGRHEAILLPWRAAIEALSNAAAPR